MRFFFASICKSCSNRCRSCSRCSASTLCSSPMANSNPIEMVPRWIQKSVHVRAVVRGECTSNMATGLPCESVDALIGFGSGDVSVGTTTFAATVGLDVGGCAGPEMSSTSLSTHLSPSTHGQGCSQSWQVTSDDQYLNVGFRAAT